MTFHDPIGSDGECRRFLPLLLAAVQTRDSVGPDRTLGRDARSIETAAADHLDRCDACRSEATEAALALIRIRRWAEESAAQDPSADGWLRLRARLETSRRRAHAAAWQARANLAGLVASALIVAVVVGPLSVAGSADGWSPAREPTGPSRTERFVGPIELAYVERARQATETAGPIRPPVTSPGQPLLPDGIKPAPKEVTPSEPGDRTRDVS